MDAPGAKARWASQRRVPRASRACETCRSRKTKCDQAQPCSYCAYHSFNCVYRTSGGRGTAREPQAQRKRAVRATQQRDGNSIRPSPWPGLTKEAISPDTPGVADKNQAHTGNSVAESPFPLGGHPRTLERPYTLREFELAGPETPATATDHEDDESVASELGDAASRDGLSGVNLHTKGTEFYGNSSNLAFLGNLFARAQHQSQGNHPLSTQNVPQAAKKLQASSPESRSTSGRAQLSIVNLLYNADYTGHPSPQSYDSPSSVSRGALYPDTVTREPEQGVQAPGNLLPAVISQIPHTAQLEIEKIFIGSYFTNKHYIHPMLCKSTFMRRCERDAWPLSKRSSLFRGTTKFAGLYFAVIALGAINASPNETALLDHFYQQSADPEKASSDVRFSALDFAKFYFGVSKQALGDLFESSCLETAQALLCLSVFRQNSLQPHSCYMYSGMAVRTAAAIGLASGMHSLPPNKRREARRTWWCIYSHEVEMCCSSGRLDSMKELHYYQASLPKLKIHVGDQDPDAEDNDVAMIPVMVSLAQIMSEASHQLYHSTQHSIEEKSRLAMILDARLQEWKSNLPSFLNLDANTLNDPEWAFKQKLVLRLRYYNTRILIHRPFLVASTTDTESRKFLQHLHICIEAARLSIRMQYESFMHRIYIRTWWYNTTYALYGSMILLHLILSNFPGLPDEELLEDVEKSLEIFASMDDIIVARRCAEMLREVLDVARTCLRRRQTQTTLGAGTETAIGVPMPFGPAGLPTPSRSHLSNLPSTLADVNVNAASGISFENSGLGSGLDHAGLGDGQRDDEDFFFDLFSSESSRAVVDDRMRTEVLANLVDPSVLEDFAFGGEEFSCF